MIAFLRNRTNKDPDISTASSFYSLRQATGLINMTLNENRLGIIALLERPGQARAVIHATFDRPTGHSVTRGVGGYTTVNSVMVVLQKPAATPEGFVVWTAFPAPP